MYYPVLLKIGSVSLYTYGIFIVLAFLISGLFILWEAKKKKLDFSRLLNFSPYLIIGVMVGARIYYVLQHLSYYKDHLLETFYFWQGGLSMYGGVIVAFLLLLIFLRKEGKRQRWQWLDALGMGFLLGSAVGRIGCFLNGCCFGEECNLPWAVTNGFLNDGVLRHPTQIYEAIFYFLIFVVIFLVSSKWGKKIAVGTVFFLSISLHSLVRFIVEFFRFSDSFIGPFKTAYVATLLIMILAVTIFFVTIKTRTKLKGASK